MVNTVVLIGRLGDKPIVRKTQTGRSVASIRLATNETWKDAAGNKQERTTWHNVVAWSADFCGEWNKGDLVYVEGSIQIREYESGGVKRTAFEIVANRVNRLSAKQVSAEVEVESDDGFFG